MIIQSQGLRNNLNDRQDGVVSFSPVLKSAGFNDVPLSGACNKNAIDRIKENDVFIWGMKGDEAFLWMK